MLGHVYTAYKGTLSQYWSTINSTDPQYWSTTPRSERSKDENENLKTMQFCSDNRVSYCVLLSINPLRNRANCQH